jgi:hypothetical protein
MHVLKIKKVREFRTTILTILNEWLNVQGDIDKDKIENSVSKGHAKPLHART